MELEDSVPNMGTALPSLNSSDRPGPDLSNMAHQARLLVKDKSLGKLQNRREEYLGKSQVDPRQSFELEMLQRNHNRKQGPQWYSTIPAQGETRHTGQHIGRYRERHIIQDPLRLSAILPSL
jgi:hypothetical protein